MVWRSDITVSTTSLSKIYQTTLIMGYLMKWWNCWHHGGDYMVDILQPAFSNTVPKYYVFGFGCRWITLLTLNERGPSYFSLTSSISWLLMSWLLSSPGHHQPWWWLYRIGMSLAYWARILNACVMSMWRNAIKCKYDRVSKKWILNVCGQDYL